MNTMVTTLHPAPVAKLPAVLAPADWSPQKAAHKLAKPKIREGYQPQALHVYRDAGGKSLYWRVRLKHPHPAPGRDHKWVRPMRLDPDGWREAEPEFPRGQKPLYGLDRLAAADPSAPVWIVEGELCVDALGKLGIVAVTSGSCSSADGCDWSPVKGHSVIAWPDHDDPGAKYILDATRHLQALGCMVRLVGKGVIESLPEGGDVVDWLAQHSGATADDIRKLTTVEAPALYTPQNNRATVQPPPAEPPAIARQACILARFKEAIRGCKVVGEECNAATVYLAITSRLLDKPVSLAVKGPSSSGKSFTTEKTVEFFPPEAVIVMTAMSQRALVYSKEEYAHRSLIIYEATALREGNDEDLTSYFVRSLLSEGRIEYPVTVRDKEGGFTTKTIVKEGPTNMILTTTKTKVHAENETRLLSLSTNDTREQTAAILTALADEAHGELDKAEWQDFQRWLQSDHAEHRVTIPYATALAGLVPPVATRLRRDFGQVLSLIRAHALLHQLSRGRDADGRIVAAMVDYAEVRELVAGIVAEGVGSTVSVAVRETIEAVGQLAGDKGVSALKVGERLHLDKSTASRRLRRAADGGYIRNLEDHRGKPSCWVIGDPLPEAVELLPRPERLQPCNPSATAKTGGDGATLEDGVNGCTVARLQEGIKRGAPNADDRDGCTVARGLEGVERPAAEGGDL